MDAEDKEKLMNQLIKDGKQVLEDAKVLYELDEVDSLLMATVMMNLPPVSEKRVVKILKGLAHIIENTAEFGAQVRKLRDEK